MKIISNRYIISFFLLLFLYSLNSCHEKGCTNRNAINYNSAADEDDGSCVTCTVVTDTLGVMSSFLEDNNSSGPHPFQNVAQFFLYQLKNRYSNSACGSSNCYFIATVKSLVPEKMQIEYELESNIPNIFQSSTVTVFGHSTGVTDSIPSTNVSNPCEAMDSTSFSIFNEGITYTP